MKFLQPCCGMRWTLVSLNLPPTVLLCGNLGGILGFDTENPRIFAHAITASRICGRDKLEHQYPMNAWVFYGNEKIARMKLLEGKHNVAHVR